MDLATLFGKLREHEMELKRLTKDEEGDRKKKNLSLKSEEKDFDSSDEEMTLISPNFKRFMK